MKAIEIEFLDGNEWRWGAFRSFADYNDEPYALIVAKVFVLSFYLSLKEAERARESTDQQLDIIGHVARFFGYAPIVYQVRRLENNLTIEV